MEWRKDDAFCSWAANNPFDLKALADMKEPQEPYAYCAYLAWLASERYHREKAEVE